MASASSDQKIKSAEADSGVAEPPSSEKHEKSSDSGDSQPVSCSEVGSSHVGDSKLSAGSPILKPSAFNPQKGGTGGSILAPAKLAANPFAAKTNLGHAVSSASDSEEEHERPIVAPSHFNISTQQEPAEPVATVQSPTKSILRPSALDKQTANFNKAKLEFTPNKTSFVLKPATMESPLTVKVKETSAFTALSDSHKNAPVELSSDKLFAKTTSSEATKENYFSQFAAQSEVTQKTDTNGDSSFVFGQNMDSRVENAKEVDRVSSSSTPSGFVFGQDLADRAVNTPDKSGVPDKEKSGEAEEVPSNSDEPTSPKQSLEQSAAAHQAKQAKPEYQEVQVATGEEDESNVFQIYSKLFVYDKAQQTWSEKGRGSLRLNDMSDTDGGQRAFQSRLVMRTQGSLRVILNTKIWPGMTVERASAKAVRITATDSEGIKVYLIMTNPKDAEQIFSAIDWRVQQQKVCEQEREAWLAGTAESDWSHPQESTSPRAKRSRRPESPDSTDTAKKPRYEPEARRPVPEETSNDSSTVDPDTEVSNESFTSSPVVKSSPSTTSE